MSNTLIDTNPAVPTDGTSYDKAAFYQRVRDMVYDLGNEFGRSQHSLKLFQRLLQRLEEEPNANSQEQVVGKFERFVRMNRKGIVARDAAQLTVHLIVYHGNINIKMGEIFRLADESAKTTIWAHLQCLLNVLDPDNEEVERALRAYQQTQQVSGEIDESSREAQFIKSIISDIQPTIDTNGQMGSNPLGGIDLMGMLSKVTSMLDSTNGQGLDPEKLLNTVHTLSMRELGKVKQRPV